MICGETDPQVEADEPQPTPTIQEDQNEEISEEVLECSTLPLCVIRRVLTAIPTTLDPVSIAEKRTHILKAILTKLTKQQNGSGLRSQTFMVSLILMPSRTG